MIIVVTGSRTANHEIVTETLKGVYSSQKIAFMFSGHCNQGADLYSEDFAKARSIPLILVPAMWGAGKTAGFSRNSYMLDIANEYAHTQALGIRLVAFPRRCRLPACTREETHWTHGTEDCWNKAIELNMPRKYFTDDASLFV